MINTLNFLFFLASAMGATIIVSKGDIFLPFRTWVFSKSKKNKQWVHEVIILPNTPLVSFNVNGDTDDSISKIDNLYINEDINRGTLDHNILRAWLIIKCSDWRIKAEILPDFSTKINISSDKKLNLAVTTGGFTGSFRPFSSYENFDKVKWVSFIHDMISCPQCCGVWIGMIWYSLYRLGAMDIFVFKMLCTGCIVSLFASIYWKIHDLLNNVTNKK